MKPKKPQQSPISTPTNRRLRQAIALSLALHAPLVSQERLGEVWDERGNIAYVTKENAKSILNDHPLERRRYVEQLKEALERGEHIDLGEFYLKTQYLDGRLEEDRMRDALDELVLVESDVRVDKEKLRTLDVLSGITSREGESSEPNSYLSTLLLEGKGNCKARERFSSALVDRLYPDMEMAYQKVKLDGGPHTRTLVKVDGQWRNMENPKAPPLSEADLAGTVLFSKYDYVKHYVGQGDLGVYRKPPVPIETHTELLITDDYLAPPLPGVDFDNIKNVGIKDVGSVDSEASEVDSVNVSRSFIGSAAPVAKNGQLGTWGSRFAHDPIELEIFDADDVERNRRKTQDVLSHWQMINEAGELRHQFNFILPKMNDYCVDALIPFVKEGAKRVLEDCKLHESSGLLSCEYGADYLVSRPAKDTNFAGANCLPYNPNRCSSYNRKNSEGKFRMDAYIKLMFALSLERMFGDELNIKDDSLREQVRLVALATGFLDQTTYMRIVDWIRKEHCQFVGLTDDKMARFGCPGGERFMPLGNMFEDFYCQY